MKIINRKEIIMNSVNNVAKISSPKGIFLLLHSRSNGIDEFFVAINYYTFTNWTVEQRNQLKVVQMVSNTIFFPDNQPLLVDKIKFTEADDNLSYIFYDCFSNSNPNFLKLISNIEKSDCFENSAIFKSVNKVLFYDEISENAKIVVCEYFDNLKKTYFEINGNEYFEINSEIFELIKKGKIDKYIN